MMLKGKVNKIERINARSGRGDTATEEEKRVYSLTVRLPDPSLTAQYNYGYGNMNFVLHGKQMEDFVDLGGDCDVYVLRRGEVDSVPNQGWHQAQSTIYRLEGELIVAKANLATAIQGRKEAEQNAQEARVRLNGAMQEAIRLTAKNEALRAVRGHAPAAPAQLGHNPAQGIEARRAETQSGSVHESPVAESDAP